MTTQHTIQDIYTILDQVCDPEIPVLTILDLGIVRDVRMNENETEIIITPTYSGCPAMNVIEAEIHSALEDAGIWPVKVTTVLSPAWTTEWMTENGRAKLLQYGIAPPAENARLDAMLGMDSPKACPNCGSSHTEIISQFGSTACKALYKCLDCQEPFDYFKCH